MAPRFSDLNLSVSWIMSEHMASQMQLQEDPTRITVDKLNTRNID
jgi:hypothetical protein